MIKEQKQRISASIKYGQGHNSKNNTINMRKHSSSTNSKILGSKLSKDSISTFKAQEGDENYMMALKQKNAQDIKKDSVFAESGLIRDFGSARYRKKTRIKKSHIF